MNYAVKTKDNSTTLFIGFSYGMALYYLETSCGVPFPEAVFHIVPTQEAPTAEDFEKGYGMFYDITQGLSEDYIDRDGLIETLSSKQ